MEPAGYSSESLQPVSDKIWIEIQPQGSVVLGI
jgi:hypothetical protein